MSRRNELGPEEWAIIDKKMAEVRSTIKYAVKRDGRTIAAISQNIGLSRTAISNFVNGDYGITLGTLILIAEELGLEIVIQERESPMEPSREIAQEIIKDVKDRKDEAIKKADACRISGEWNEESYWQGMKDAMEYILRLYGDES